MIIKRRLSPVQPAKLEKRPPGRYPPGKLPTVGGVVAYFAKDEQPWAQRLTSWRMTL